MEQHKVSYASITDSKFMTIYLKDGKGFTLDLGKFPIFETVSEKSIQDYTLTKYGIKWNKLGHEVSFKGFLNLCRVKLSGDITYDEWKKNQ